MKQIRNKKLKSLLYVEERNASWLARKLDVSPTLVHYWVRGKRNIHDKYLQRISNIFNIDVLYFD